MSAISLQIGDTITATGLPEPFNGDLTFTIALSQDYGFIVLYGDGINNAIGVKNGIGVTYYEYYLNPDYFIEYNNEDGWSIWDGESIPLNPQPSGWTITWPGSGMGPGYQPPQPIILAITGESYSVWHGRMRLLGYI